MKLPYCPSCGSRSRLAGSKRAGYDLACLGCSHAVYGHARAEAAVKAFLWAHGNAAGVSRWVVDDKLACGCPVSGCKCKTFETEAKAS